MIKQRFALDNWNWDVRVYYAVHGYYVDEIVSRLMDMGISRKKLKKAEKLLTSGELNTGLTFVKNGRALAVIRRAENAAEYADSIQHEVMHLALFIGREEGLNPFGEEVCYMGGEIAKKMWPASKLLTSECGCYTNYIGREL